MSGRPYHLLISSTVPADAFECVDETAKAFAKYFGEVADSLSLTTNAVEEAKLPDDLRAEFIENWW